MLASVTRHTQKHQNLFFAMKNLIKLWRCMFPMSEPHVAFKDVFKSSYFWFSTVKYIKLHSTPSGLSNGLYILPFSGENCV